MGEEHGCDHVVEQAHAFEYRHNQRVLQDLMPALTHNQLIFRDRLASRLGLDKAVVGAWIYHEQNGSAAQSYEKRKYYNWLNIGRTDTGDTGDAAHSIWSDPTRAADATVSWIEHKSAPAIRNALAGARGKSPVQQATAIANSPWASSHYGGPQGLIGLLKIGGQGSGGGVTASPVTPATTRIPGQTITSTIPTVDQAGFEQARKLAIVGGLIARRNPNSFLLRSGLLSTQEPTLSNFVGSKTVKDVIPGATVRTPATAQASFSTPAGQSGVANFEGKKVAAWIEPALKYARAHGWKGTVNSGYRSFADQTRIYNSGVRPAAKPGTSNHEGTQFPRGAVDVSDAPTLSAILQRSPYGKRLKWAGSKDPVHFSHPHNGSY